jgi:tetratricopeptide (TPR) repeat protein
MKRLAITLYFVAAVTAAHAAGGNMGNNLFLNRIEGQIFDDKGTAVGDMYVELQNDVGSALATHRSTATGRFSFEGLSNGGYRVRVLASGKNFLEQSQDVDFIPSRSGRSDDIRYIEFYLRLDKRFVGESSLASPDVVFVQSVPEDAKTLYRSGVDSLDKGQVKGLETLESAITAFPTYFDALSRLGKEYAIRQQYVKAYPLLLRAIDINARSFSSYYFLGFSFYKLNEIPAAVKAAQACTVLMPNNLDAHVLLGTVLRINGDLKEAETELKKALSISKGQSAQAHWQMALVLNRLGRNSEAADEVEAFLKLAPPNDVDKKSAQTLIAKLRSAKKS